MGNKNDIHELLLTLTDPEICDFASFPPDSEVFMQRSSTDPMQLHYQVKWTQQVEDHLNVFWLCTCRGWRFTSNCHHIDTLKASEPESVKLD